MLTATFDHARQEDTLRTLLKIRYKASAQNLKHTFKRRTNSNTYYNKFKLLFIVLSD